MERIVLEVEDYLAKAWRNSPKDLKAEYEGKISDLLRELKEKEFALLLDKARKTAQENGLTEEILNKLLNEPD